MNQELEVIFKYIKSLKDFVELQNLKLSKKDSDKALKVYKLTYLNNENNEIVLRLELNGKNEKLSFGLWSSSAMQTIKYEQIVRT